MLLKDAILALTNQKVDDDNDWYCWNDINPAKLPKGVTLPAGNAFARNVVLKRELHRLWNASQEDDQLELAKYYVAVWGGVKRNSADTLRKYVTASQDDVIANGVKGVASWSKVLCIRDPEAYAIFDARVSTSLNCLQIIHGVPNPVLYPLLPGQNRTIQKGTEHITTLAGANAWTPASEHQYYRKYLSLVSEVANSCEAPNAKIYTIEMLLFALAESLLAKAFPRTPF